MRHAVPLFLAAAHGLGCSPPTDSPPADLAQVDRAVPQDLALSDFAVGALRDLGYPGGPYDALVGTTLPDFSFPGYYAGADTSALANTHPFGTVSFADMRQSGQRYAMLMLADFW
jgi:hypothetical protein